MGNTTDIELIGSRIMSTMMIELFIFQSLTIFAQRGKAMLSRIAAILADLVLKTSRVVRIHISTSGQRQDRCQNQ